MIQRGFPVGHPDTAPAGLNYGSYVPIQKFELPYEEGKRFFSDSGPNIPHTLGENIQFITREAVHAESETACTARGEVIDSALPGVEPVVRAAFLTIHRQSMLRQAAALLKRGHAGFDAILVPHQPEI